MKKYHVKTQDDYNKLMVELEGDGVHWIDGEAPTNGNCWLLRRDMTVILLDQDIITHISMHNAKNKYQDIPIEIYNSKESGGVEEMNDTDGKVEIPKYLAEYIEELKRDGLHLSTAFVWYSNEPMPDKVKRWLFDNGQDENEKRFLTAVVAWVNGYEIEEDKYYWALSLENCIQPVFLLDDPQTSEKNYFADTVEDIKDAAYITEHEALSILVGDFHMFKKLEASEVE